MNIELVSPELLITLQMNWIELYTKAGLLAVYEGHAPMIVPLVDKKDITVHSESGATREFIVEQAIAHINRTNVTIVASYIHEKTVHRSNHIRVSV